jgi:hypothetical protein
MTVAGGAAQAGNPLLTGVPFREPQAHVGRQDSPPSPTVIQRNRHEMPNTMEPIPNFEKSDLAEALELIAHMLTIIALREQPEEDDIKRLRWLAKQIRNSR